ncbi:hypothetical protein PIROE2DRAFT_65718 [Piromyces sp. E2]|nr:hypothetical protein PIROE2DRAFT_65718 [Piromyces sp. E2]|eukprot:OUM56115.1 hypothetical protein PIROE2DRAFT_65718 [Piromyces sp. E2]
MSAPLSKIRNDLGKINILIVGKLGVGKITLINAMFGKELAINAPEKPIEYTHENYPVSIIDTKGIEFNNYLKTINDIENYVKHCQSSNDVHSHIHAAWVCIAEGCSRVEIDVKEVIEKLSKYMIAKNSPMVKAVIRVQTLSVQLDDGYVIKPKNLEELAKLTNEYLPEDLINAAENKNVPIKAFRSDLGKVNIIVTGKLGAGKSTLINAMFGKELAKTGWGEFTQEIKEYSCGEYPVSLIDTKGIYIDFRNDINDIENYVRHCQSSNDVHSHIHAAWVCIEEMTSHVGRDIKEVIEMLSKYMSVIVVITKRSIDQGLQKIVQRECPMVKAVIRVMALSVQLDDGYVVKPKNLEELAKLTNEYLPEDLINVAENKKAPIQQDDEKDDDYFQEDEEVSDDYFKKEDEKVRDIIKQAKTKISSAKEDDNFIISGINMISKILNVFDLEIEKEFIIKISIAIFGDTETKFKKLIMFITGINIELTIEQKKKL